MQITTTNALVQLRANGTEFLELFQERNLSIEIYQPNKIDKQQPHTRDEIYVVIAGTGQFINNGITTDFQAGDLLFVKAGIEHRFLNFSEDFSTWVIFF